MSQKKEEIYEVLKGDQTGRKLCLSAYVIQFQNSP